MNRDLIAIFEYLEREKGIKREIIVSAIENALQMGARKSVEDVGTLNVTVDPKTGEIDATTEKEVVKEVEYPDEEISLDDAREIDPNCQIGQWLDVEIDPTFLGRIAAQTARQVITQTLRGAERDVIYEEYRHRVGEIVSGGIKRLTKNGSLIVDLGKVEAILPLRYYPKTEHYNVGEKVMALLYEVRDTDNGGAEVVLTRSHPEFVVELFKQEVPELSDGTIEIKRIVREAGFRTKMAVHSSDFKVDPVGACVGVRGTRVKNVIRELNNEKIDVLPYADDPIMLLKNAMAPAEPKKITVDEEANLITVVIQDEDYPAVIGKKGINARLTGDLLGCEIKVFKSCDFGKHEDHERKKMSLIEAPQLDEPLTEQGLNALIVDSFTSVGLDTPRKVLCTDLEELVKLTSVSREMVEEVLNTLRKLLNNKETSIDEEVLEGTFSNDNGGSGSSE